MTEDSLMLRQNCTLTKEGKQFVDSLKKAHIQPLFLFWFLLTFPDLWFKLI